MYEFGKNQGNTVPIFITDSFYQAEHSSDSSHLYELYMLDQNLIGLVINMITESFSLQKTSDIIKSNH